MEYTANCKSTETGVKTPELVVINDKLRDVTERTVFLLEELKGRLMSIYNWEEAPLERPSDKQSTDILQDIKSKINTIQSSNDFLNHLLNHLSQII